MVSIDWDIYNSIADWRGKITLWNLFEYVAVGWLIVSVGLLSTYALSHVDSHRPFIKNIVFLLCSLLVTGFVLGVGSSRLRQHLSGD